MNPIHGFSIGTQAVEGINPGVLNLIGRRRAMEPPPGDTNKGGEQRTAANGPAIRRRGPRRFRRDDGNRRDGSGGAKMRRAWTGAAFAAKRRPAAILFPQPGQNIEFLAFSSGSADGFAQGADGGQAAGSNGTVAESKQLIAGARHGLNHRDEKESAKEPGPKREPIMTRKPLISTLLALGAFRMR